MQMRYRILILRLVELFCCVVLVTSVIIIVRMSCGTLPNGIGYGRRNKETNKQSNKQTESNCNKNLSINAKERVYFQLIHRLTD